MKLSFKSMVVISIMFIVGIFLLFSTIKSNQESVKKQIEETKVYNLNFDE